MEQIVKESFLAVPHLVVVLANAVHGVSDPDKMFDKAVSNVFIHGVVFRQNERDLQHVLAIESHPGGTICLIEVTARRELGTAVEHSDIVESKKPAGEDVLTLRVFPVNPPVEVQHQALKRALQETKIRAAQLFFNVVKK